MKDLTKEQKYDLACITLASIQIQSAIHTLDNVSGMGNDFKFKKKKDWNDFIDYVRRWANKEGVELYSLTGSFNNSNVQNYVECVTEFDRVAEKIIVTID